MTDENSSPVEAKVKEELKEQMYNAAVKYKNFINSDKNKVEKDNVFMISSEFIENFKNKIKYEENKDLFNEETPENKEKFIEQFKSYSLTELEAIIFNKIYILGDLDDLKEETISKGVDFVSKEFLETLEYDFDNEEDEEIKDINPDNFKVKYIKDGCNIIIIFNDESKLLIITLNNQTKYHAIPPPITSKPNKVFKKRNTICISNRKKKRVTQLVLTNKKKEN